MSGLRVSAGGSLAALALALPMMLAMALVAGCAYMPPAPDAMKIAVSPADSAVAPAHLVPARTPPSPTAAAVDSTPSRDAADVLATIPEPLAPGERVPPPDRASFPADSAAHDAAAAPDDTMPVPEPTRPLGDAPGTIENTPLPDSLFTPAHGTPSVTPPPAAPDTCFRVQFTAPADRKTAELKRKAAESLLFVTCVIEPSAGLFKVRSRDCASRAAADALRARARDSGFDGAFRFVEKTR